MPWWGQATCVLGAGIILSFWSWVALSIIKLQKEIVALKAEVDIREKECVDRLAWLIRIESKIDKLVTSVARLIGRLDEGDVMP